jgi:hypothetical protein
MRWPRKETREHWEFVFKAVQSTAVVIGVLWAAYTFSDTRTRELQKPYEEKRLAFYTEAARVLAHLSSRPEVLKLETEARFFELFWGELPFVESPEIKSVMEEFCRDYFTGSTCEKSEAGRSGIALRMSKQGSKEIRDKWTGRSLIDIILQRNP